MISDHYVFIGCVINTKEALPHATAKESKVWDMGGLSVCTGMVTALPFALMDLNDSHLLFSLN